MKLKNSRKGSATLKRTAGFQMAFAAVLVGAATASATVIEQQIAFKMAQIAERRKYHGQRRTGAQSEKY